VGLLLRGASPQEYLIWGILFIGWPCILWRGHAMARAIRGPFRDPFLDTVEARARKRLCPGCGYDLRGSPPGLPLDRLGGVDVGPRACPECGSVWPLVPPPADVPAVISGPP
jgi:hypothetical protein